MSLKKKYVSKLLKITSVQEAEAEFDFILYNHFNLNKTDVLLNKVDLSEYETELDEFANKRISERMPLQYILNKAFFMEDEYYVDNGVLIPRPETELLVATVLKYATDKSKILDIGTGSGCIAISLAKYLKSDNVSACDISDKALNIAKKNAKNIIPNHNINFILSDLFSSVSGKFDIIVSNPPYIDSVLKCDMEDEVLNHEPHSALFAKNSGMFFYEKIIADAKKYLTNHGIIAFEVGINQSSKVANLLDLAEFKKVIIIPDLSSIDRIVLGIL